MATAPRSLEIRTYQVGFGDCFLLSFFYEKKPRHVLIDFGSTGVTPRKTRAPDKKPSAKTKKTKKKSGFSFKDHMRKVAEDIQRVCGTDGLAAVVATHRHADHINGFGTEGETGRSGEVIRALKPRVVLQPW